MKIVTKLPKVSVIIVNFNNAIYLNQSIDSILGQNYKNIEIIVVDNKSTDNSLYKLKKYKNKIIVLKNTKKSNQGSYNQINSYYKGYLKSKGEYIFFLDSDDYYKKNKIKLIINQFLKEKDIKLIFDLPIFKYKKNLKKEKFKQKFFVLSNWPRFSPQSCISIKRKYCSEIFNKVKINKFESIWFDFRIASYHYLKNGQIHVLKKYLTYYRQLDESASKNYKLFSKNWWYRRNQAHDFIAYFSNKLNILNRITLDKIITKVAFFFLK